MRRAGIEKGLLPLFHKTGAVCASIFVAAALAMFCPSALAGSVRLAWNASPGPNVGGYRVHYGLSSGSYPNKVSVGIRTSYTLSGLAPTKTYYIAVTALNAIGSAESGFSNEVSVTIPPDNNAAAALQPILQLLLEE